ncbi:lysylphosphatidylglycerol synthase transmembrane domain-containing protein [Halomonas koreensis]|uniref:Lysylphosphatidylglycerol synthase transmembrane domain-containing protein n=1 Tax=Halomonas koreensis TaxID=245385 RepID=A0ABU1G512_9GAMM|nr:lysylphosphatidylglycerol synthase transmembrane domain-containing protein [Halomonas koreensis]MDR5867567.1 lysylphosphatidylglycerol synthase transmembrane domain-containing protein [Halomonas koreensis]
MASDRQGRRAPGRAGWLALAVVLALVVPLLIGGREALTALTGFPPAWLAAMLAMVGLGWNLNAARLRLLLAGRAGRLGQRRALGLVMATEFATCATPGGSGGPPTLLALLARHGLRPARASAVFTIDQCCDLVFFLAALLVVAPISLAGAMAWPSPGLLGGAIAGLALLLSGLALGIRRLPALLRRRRGGRRGRRLARRLLHFRQALLATLALPRPTLALVMACCAGHWLLRYSLLYLALAGLGAEVDWAWTFVVQMLAMAAGQLSLLPGGAGAAELGTGMLLVPLVGQATAGAAIAVWRLTTYHWYLLAGAPVFLALLGARRAPGRS